jgi:hypothetical protein
MLELPEPDKEVFEKSEFRDMFLEDIRESFRQRNHDQSAHLRAFPAG